MPRNRGGETPRIYGLGLLGQARARLRRSAGLDVDHRARSRGPWGESDRKSFYRRSVGGFFICCVASSRARESGGECACGGWVENAASGVYISARRAAVKAPPANKPLPGEIENCSEYLDREWKLLRNVRVLLALGAIGWEACLDVARRNGCEVARSAKFGHGAVVKLSERLTLVGSYHVSQQNTFTGKLTTAMIDEILCTCKRIQNSKFKI